MTDPPALEPDEIIPPGRRPMPARPASEGAGYPPVTDLRGLLPAIIAKWLDELLRIPGTSIKIGLDPLLALIPGLGDAASTSAGAVILLTAVRHHTPVKTLVRMAGNMVVNAILNLLPLIGPAVSIWFRSNSRNNRMLQHHLAGRPPGPASPQTKILLAAVLVFVALLFVFSIMVWMAVFRFLSGLFQ